MATWVFLKGKDQTSTIASHMTQWPRLCDPEISENLTCEFPLKLWGILREILCFVTFVTPSYPNKARKRSAHTHRHRNTHTHFFFHEHKRNRTRSVMISPEANQTQSFNDDLGLGLTPTALWVSDLFLIKSTLRFWRMNQKGSSNPFHDWAELNRRGKLACN